VDGLFLITAGLLLYYADLDSGFACLAGMLLAFAGVLRTAAASLSEQLSCSKLFAPYCDRKDRDCTPCFPARRKKIEDNKHPQQATHEEGGNS
jgi:hypothetical protein